MKNNLIIFSKNRACQLHLLLTSIKQNTNYLFDNISVLYTGEGEYKSGYEKLIEMYSNINFIFETNFKENLLELINNDYSHTTFSVDDVIIYKSIPDSYKEDILNVVKGQTTCFSLRLGLNCNYSHPANLSYKIGEYNELDNDMISFNFREQSGDFGYPLSVDCHIFETRYIKSLIESINFNNPNTLEANLQSYLPIIEPKIYSFKESKVVGVPVNLVNNTFKNKNGLEFGISPEELNNKFMSGEVINLDELDFSNINGPHKEIKYKFIKNEK